MSEYSTNFFGASIDTSEMTAQSGAGIFTANTAGAVTFLAKGNALQVLRTNSAADSVEWGSGVGLTLLKRSTLASAATTLDAASITSTGYNTLLILVCVEKNDDDGNERDLTIQFNGDTSANYTHRFEKNSVTTVTSGDTKAKIGTYRNTGKPFIAVLHVINNLPAQFLAYTGNSFDCGVGNNFDLGGFLGTAQSSLTRILLTSVTANIKANSFIEVYGVS